MTTISGRPLVGRRIVAVKALDARDLRALGWEGQHATCLVFDDNTWLYVSSDEEQNSAGTMWYVDQVGEVQYVCAPRPDRKAIAGGAWT